MFLEDAEDSLQWGEERSTESSWAVLAVVQIGGGGGWECQVVKSEWILDVLGGVYVSSVEMALAKFTQGLQDNGEKRKSPGPARPKLK